MQEIRMVDLAAQHAKIKDELAAAMQEVVDTTAFIKGPQVGQFEKELGAYLGNTHVTACGNGTDALQLALMALDLPAGCEVITPDFTFVATAEVVRLLGYTPVLVDVDMDTFNILPEKIEAAITDKTRVIIPVHLFGQCADMEAIMDIAQKHNLYVVEDTAQAIGTDHTFADGSLRRAGTIGHIGCTSFFPSKNLGCMGDGGALFTADAELHHKIQMIANHGQGSQYRYEKIGVNSRLDTLQAAVLRIKLQRLDEYNAARQKAAAAYDEALKGIDELQVPVRSAASTHTFHQYTLRVLNGKRNALMQHLTNKKVPNKVYYPEAIHTHKPYQAGSRFALADLKNTIALSEEVLSLPMHTELSAQQLTYITTAVKGFFK